MMRGKFRELRIQDFLKGGGVQIRSTSKKGGARRESNFGPNVKKPTSWHKGGVLTPWTPPLDPPLGIRHLTRRPRLCLCRGSWLSLTL